MQIGSQAATAFKIGAQDVDSIYVGSTLVFSATSQTITVASGGVQPGAEQVFDGEDATAGIPDGADALANFETSAPGEQIKRVTVSVSVDGAAPVVISEEIRSVDPTLNSVTFAAGGAGEPDSITLDVAYTGSDTLEATVETLNGATTLETVTVALAVPWDNLDLSGLTSASETADSVEVTVSEANNGGASATVQETVSGLDLTDPAFDSAATNTDGNTTTITLTEAVYGTITTGDVAINEDGSPITLSSVGFTEGQATISVVHAALSVGSTVTVDYSGTDLTDAKGNTLDTFSGETVTNNTVATSAMEADANGLYWFNDTGVTESGGTLTAWADSKGNVSDLIQLGSAPRPGWNGSAATFDGTQIIGCDISASADTLSNVLELGGEVALFIVATLDSSSQGVDSEVTYSMVREAFGPGLRGIYCTLIQNTFGTPSTKGNSTAARFSGAYTISETLPVGNANGVKVLIELRVTQSNAEMFQDGTSFGTATVTPSNFPGPRQLLTLGAESAQDGTSLGEAFIGSISEVYATSSTGTQQLLDIRAELTNKHLGGA